MILVVTLLTPFILFIGGSYLLHYPVSLGVLYAVNVVLIYLVSWAVANQAVRINSQRMRIEGDSLVIEHKQLFTTLPLVRVLDIEIPVPDIREIGIVSSGVGYQMTVRFMREEKVMGVDFDLNPLNPDNVEVIKQLANLLPQLGFEEGTQKIMADYQDKIGSWKRTYVLSAAVICFSLVVFLVISIYLGSRAILGG